MSKGSPSNYDGVEFPEDGVVFPGNYSYDVKGTLRNRNTAKQFAFTTQEDYDALAEAVLGYCASQLDEVLQRRVDVEGLDGVPVWVSPDLNKKEKVLVLFQGSGRVRAGVWGCALCINAENGFHKGTMFEYIERAQKDGYGVVVLNPNAAEDLGAHLVYSWEHLVEPALAHPDDSTNKPSPSKFVDIIAHSNGGKCLFSLLTATQARHANTIKRLWTEDKLKKHAETNPETNAGRGLRLSDEGCSVWEGPSDASLSGKILRNKDIDYIRFSLQRIRKIALTDSYHHRSQYEQLSRLEVENLQLVEIVKGSGVDIKGLFRNAAGVAEEAQENDPANGGFEPNTGISADGQPAHYFHNLLSNPSTTLNYVPSEEKFGTPVKQWVSLKNVFTVKDKAPCPCISCETEDHASTNYTSCGHIFEEFFK